MKKIRGDDVLFTVTPFIAGWSVHQGGEDTVASVGTGVTVAVLLAIAWVVRRRRRERHQS